MLVVNWLGSVRRSHNQETSGTNQAECSHTIRQRATPAQEQEIRRSQPTKPNRCRTKIQTQFEPESNPAIGQHLLKFNQCISDL